MRIRLSDASPVVVAQLDQSTGPLHRVAGLIGHGLTEEPDPRVRITILVDGLEVPDVGVPKPFQIGAHIQQRSSKAPTVYEEEHNEEAADAAVAVQERVDRFELIVHQRALRQQRQCR